MRSWQWLTWLQTEDTGPVSLSEISLRQNISLPYLEQIFIKLKNFKLVKSLRGPLGGYVLDRPASEIKISYIINAVDEEVKTLNCKKTQKGLSQQIHKMYYPQSMG